MHCNIHFMLYKKKVENGSATGMPQEESAAANSPPTIQKQEEE